MIYDTKTSIALTYVFLIGGSVASLWNNSKKINSKTGRTFVNYDIIILTIPIMNSGAMLGVKILLNSLC
jgi:hypothetical protein